MGDFRSVLPLCEGDQHVIAATRHLVKALGASKNLDDDLRKILSQLESRLSAMNVLSPEIRGTEFREFEQQFKWAEEKILGWESNQSLIWDSDPPEASEYLKAVVEIQTLVEGLPRLSMGGSKKWKELLNRAESILETAMSRLKEELVHILVKHKQYFELGNKSFQYCRKDVVYDESFVSVEDMKIEEASQRDNSGNESVDCVPDLVHPQVIPHLKSIATVMFASNYHQEFCQAFISVRRDALEEYLVILKVEKFSIEDVLKMEWSSLNFEIRKWIRALNVIIRYLASEKRLCDQVFGDLGFLNPFCFVEISKVALLHLLNFGEAIAMGTHGPEKLFRLLDMYEVVADNLLYIDTIFSEESGTCVRIEFHQLLSRLADSARATLLKFGNAIAADASTSPVPRGEIHPLTRYVMNYIKTLSIYCNILNVLLKDQNAAASNPVVELENELELSSMAYCPMARRLRSITCILEPKLDSHSRLYKDCALQHIFLINNYHYMVEKVKSSELKLFFGDKWIRAHIVKFKQHATSYERATWSSALSFLQGVRAGSSSGSKIIFKEKYRGFIIAFEEVYKSQTGWSIPNPQLREDLQISASQKVVLAYRNFIGINSADISEKYIKYTTDDLEKYILDLFEGSPKSLQRSHSRRN